MYSTRVGEKYRLNGLTKNNAQINEDKITVEPSY